MKLETKLISKLKQLQKINKTKILKLFSRLKFLTFLNRFFKNNIFIKSKIVLKKKNTNFVVLKNFSFQTTEKLNWIQIKINNFSSIRRIWIKYLKIDLKLNFVFFSFFSLKEFDKIYKYLFESFYIFINIIFLFVHRIFYTLRNFLVIIKIKYLTFGFNYFLNFSFLVTLYRHLIEGIWNFQNNILAPFFRWKICLSAKKISDYQFLIFIF